MTAMTAATATERKAPAPPDWTFDLFGGQATLYGLGSYQGTNDAGFHRWHESDDQGGGRNRREPRTTARVRFEDAKVHGIVYGGSMGLELALWGTRKGLWTSAGGDYYIRRKDGGALTDKARRALIDTIEERAQTFAKTAEGLIFFTYKAERYALEDEWHRRLGAAEELERQATELRKGAAVLANKIRRLDAKMGVAA
jgi:hypothetical protein